MITLDEAKVIARALNTFEGKPNLDALILHVERNTKYDRYAALEVIEFLQELQPTEQVSTDFSDALQINLNTKMDIAKELHYNYAVAKSLLEATINKDTPDNEEVRKTLREIARFMDSMLKMQEKVYNIQQLQAFQTRVLDLIERTLPDAREQLLLELQEAEL